MKAYTLPTAHHYQLFWRKTFLRVEMMMMMMMMMMIIMMIIIIIINK